jgi:hypothetical protein
MRNNARFSILLSILILVPLGACGSKIEAAIVIEQGFKQLSCEDSAWSGKIYFDVVINKGPKMSPTDVGINDFKLSNYDFMFKLLDRNGQVVARSSQVNLVSVEPTRSAPVGVIFSPIKGYEATQYSAYFNGEKFASEDLGVWVDYPDTPVNIINGECVKNKDIDSAEFRKKLPWCETAFRKELC